MRALLLRALRRVPRREHWRVEPDHETPSLLCRLAWHAWTVTEHRDGNRRGALVGRSRECRDCGVIEYEVRG